MVQKSENLKKSQKISKIHFFSKKKIFLKKKFFRRKKKNICYPLSFPILGGRDSTRALQSSPFQKYENLKKSKKITFFQFFFFFENFFFLPKKKKKKKMLSSQFSNIRRTGFDQSSPVNPVSEYRGGPLSVTHEHTYEGRRKSSCLILDYSKLPKVTKG